MSLLTPKALAVAELLFDLTHPLSGGRCDLTLSDQDLADVLRARPDTAYRALAELRSLGAVSFTRPRNFRGYRGRALWVHNRCWVWSAVAATRSARRTQR